MTTTVYLIRLNGYPSYVGKTSQQLGARLSTHKRAKKCRQRSAWSDILTAALARGASATIEPLCVGDTDDEATRLEEEWTRHLFAAGIPLGNRNVGGKYPPESRAKISAATKRQEFAKGVRGIVAVPVRDLDTGEIFESVSAAARSVDALQSTLTLAIQRGGRCHGHRFEKLATAPGNDNSQRKAA